MKRILNFLKDNLLSFLVIFLFILIVLTNKNFYMFYPDEFHAYNIAKEFGLFDIIRLMRAEGHTFIWYTILKLVPHNEFFFPWMLKWFSGFFSLIAVCLLWFKSPFSHVEKFLITFSFPMLFLYPTIARPYSLGIMLLFMLTVFYKKRLEHPILFATLIYLTANTSLMAAVGAFSFSILFIYDLIKSKNKNFIPALLILTFCALTLYIQWHNPIIPDYIEKLTISQCFLNLKHFDLKIIEYTAYIVLPIFFITSTICMKNNKKLLFFFWLNTLALLGIFIYVYHGCIRHHYFFYIYWVISYWIFLYEDNLPKYASVAFLICNLLFFAYLYKNESYYCSYQKYVSYTKLVSILVPENSTLYVSLVYNNMLHIHKDSFKTKKINLKYFDGSYLFDFNNYLNIYNSRSKYTLDDIIKNADNNSYIILCDGEIKMNNPNYKLITPYVRIFDGSYRSLYKIIK